MNLALLVLVALILGCILGRLPLARPHHGALGTLPSRHPRLGPYTLGEKIGEGGMGIVYKAHHERLARPTAIKVLPKDRSGRREQERFEREVRLTSLLTHPNTISLYDSGRTREGNVYYAMEYLEGLDLQALVEKTGPQPPARVAHLLAQIAGALGHAHGLGLLHRDIKPANVFVCERGGQRDVVKVLDFGLSKEFGTESSDVDRTEAGAIVGTPMYLAPEALTAPDRMDGRSDLYALGALGYFLLTGAAPFAGKTVLEVCCQHLHCQPLPPSARVRSAIPLELERLVMNCLAKSPDGRPRDAAALRSALLPLASGWTQDRADRWWNDRSSEAPAPSSSGPRSCFAETLPGAALHQAA